MFIALFFAGVLFIAAFGGKSLLLMIASQPLIGPLAEWYMGFVNPIDDGIATNLVYGGMALHILIMALVFISFGTSLLWKVVAWVRSPSGAVSVVRRCQIAPPGD